MAVNTLIVVYRITETLTTIDSQFPQLPKFANPLTLAAVLSELSLTESREQISRQLPESLLNPIQTESTVTEKVKWVLKSDKSDHLLRDLESLVNSLESLLPPPTDPTNAALVLSSWLSSDDTVWLDTLARSSEGIPPAFANVAELKSLSRKIRTKLMVTQTTVTSKQLRIRPSTATGTYMNNPVLIEWKEHEKTWIQNGIQSIMYERVNNIARLLRHGTKPIALCTLYCHGIFEQALADGTSRFGFVFALPHRVNDWIPSSCSLRDLLHSEASKPFLGQRFKLARKLAVSILTLHLSGWLHKGIRSHNVMFFPESADMPIDVSRPYLCGFDYSRADELDEETERTPANVEDDLYRHPDYQGVPVEHIAESTVTGSEGENARVSYIKTFDIYSLGIILLEIARWRPAILWPENKLQGML